MRTGPYTSHGELGTSALRINSKQKPSRAKFKIPSTKQSSNMKTSHLLLIATLMFAATFGANAQEGQPVLQRIKVGASPPLSSAMKSVLIMVVVFFIVEVGSYAFNVQGEITKMKNAVMKSDGEDKGMLEGVVKMPAEIQKQLDNIRDFLQTTELVTKQIPMLAILIVFARLRAKVDLEGTDPAQYAQNAFITIGVLIAIQAGALFLDTCENATLKIFNIVVQGLCKLSIMVCVVIVIESIFSLKKTAPKTTPSF